MSRTRGRLLSLGSWPISAKMSADLLLAAMVPLVLGFWFTSLRARSSLESAAQENLRLLAGITATRLDQLCTDTQRMIDQVSRDDAVVALCQAKSGASAGSALTAVQRRMSLVVATNPDVASVFIADTAGIGIAGTRAENVGMDFNFRDYFKSARDGKPFISQMLVGKTSTRPGVYFSMPIRAPGEPETHDEVIGVAVLKLQGERIAEIVESVRVGESGSAMLVSRDGVIIVHPNHALLYHSLGPLAPDRLKTLDPKTEWNVDAIPSAGMEGLMPLVAGAKNAGTASISVNAATDAAPATWVAGFAPMTLRDWSIVVMMPHAQFMAPMRALFREQAIVVLAVALLAGALALWRARSIVEPIVELTRAADRLASGDFEARATKRHDDEIGQLADVFNDMVPRLKEHVDLQQSLAVAMEVQQSLLPAGDPSMPNLDIAGRSRYCDQTGGDYYDFLDVSRLGDSRALIAVGDVMGHGIAAALLMATARAALRAHAHDEESLASLMTKVNRVLAADARHNRFMTLALVVVDSERRRVRWASAGHDPTIAYLPSEDRFIELEGGDVPLGVIDGIEYQEYSRDGFAAGTLLIIGTDGIWESRNPQDDLYGKVRLRVLLREAHREPAAEIATVIQRQLDEFRGPAATLDDITFVVIKMI